MTDNDGLLQSRTKTDDAVVDQNSRRLWRLALLILAVPILAVMLTLPFFPNLWQIWGALVQFVRANMLW